jgi:hypothetical protein
MLEVYPHFHGSNMLHDDRPCLTLLNPKTFDRPRGGYNTASSDFQINADPAYTCTDGGVDVADPGCDGVAGSSTTGGRGASDFMLIEANFFHHSLAQKTSGPRCEGNTWVICMGGRCRSYCLVQSVAVTVYELSAIGLQPLWLSTA